PCRADDCCCVFVCHGEERRQGMATANTARRWSVRGLARLLLIGLVLTYAGAASVWSAPPPKVADVLLFKPRQDGVDYATPAPAADKIRAKRKTLKAKMDATCAKLKNLGPKANWLHLETGAPQCVPAEQSGAKVDVIRYTRGTVLFENGGANEWFQTGPMML